MKNIHILPTPNPSRLHLWTDEKGSRLELGELKYSNTRNTQNIYITSSDKIKYGDWVIYTLGLYVHCLKIENDADIELANIENSGVLRIILTTDQTLINDGIQAIDDEFLQWFVKNPSCLYAIVDKEEGFYEIFIPSINIEDEIIIPKEKKIYEMPLAINDLGKSCTSQQVETHHGYTVGEEVYVKPSDCDILKGVIKGFQKVGKKRPIVECEHPYKKGEKFSNAMDLERISKTPVIKLYEWTMVEKTYTYGE